MKKNNLNWLWVVLLLWAGICVAQPVKPGPVYKNARIPVDERARDLLSRMTLEEKIGQMTQLCASSITLDGTKNLDLNLDKIRAFIKNEHVGSFLSGTGKASRWVDFIRGIQEVAVHETRLGIPVLFGMDNVHGSNYTDEGTMLPHNLNLGCTFNPALAEKAGTITARESGALGHIWNFAPVLDVGKNPWWPRLYETFGEDPLVCGTMGSAFIRAFQDSGAAAPYRLAACAKHFIGYSDPKSGWDRTPSEIPDQILHEFFVPPFRMAFEAGVKTLMVNSGELNGEAVHGSRKILTHLLRQKMGFEGVVLTDIKDIMKMVEMHGAFPNEAAATKAAIDAGIDMSMACSSTEFISIVKKLVGDGQIREARLDTSVYRILKLKIELGLFEHPFPELKKVQGLGSQAHLEDATEAARQSLVLLRNTGQVLPLAKEVKSVLLAGIGSSSRKMLNGAWTLEWLGAEENRQPKATKTLKDALMDRFSDKKVIHLDSVGFDIPGNPDKEMKFLSQWKQAAEKAEVLVLALGEWPYSEFKGNASDLALSPAQNRLWNAAVETGKPLVIILLEGRPRILPPLPEGRKAALIFAGHPGTGGGKALAELLAGDFNPSGKLCFTYPAHQGHTIPYYHKKSEKYQPAFPFGFGLHYGQVEVEGVSVSDTVIPMGGKIELRVSVRNISGGPVTETVLLFNQDEHGTLTRPVSKLVAFGKLPLKAGETKVWSKELEAASLCSFPDETGKVRKEPGFHTLEAGGKKVRIRIQ